MIALVWNCRGLGWPSAVLSLKGFVRTHRPSVLFLSEVHTSPTLKIQKLCKSLGYDHLEFVSALGRSSGLVLFWLNVVNMRIVVANNSMISGIICSSVPNMEWQFTGVYGPPVPTLRPLFWDQLKVIEQNWGGPWLIIGDFNALVEQKDKLGGRAVANSSSGGFKHFIESAGLIDMGFKGAAYTWNNRRMGTANIQERLDRGLIIGTWRTCFPNAFITHLTTLNSDHRPLLLDTNPEIHPTRRPFRFETMWSRDPLPVRSLHVPGAKLYPAILFKVLLPNYTTPNMHLNFGTAPPLVTFIPISKPFAIRLKPFKTFQLLPRT